MIVYGKDAAGATEGMLQLGEDYFDSQYTRCAIHEGGVAGVIVGFPISEKGE